MSYSDLRASPEMRVQYNVERAARPATKPARGHFFENYRNYAPYGFSNTTCSSDIHILGTVE
jgi:hypothetical protein